MECTNIAEYLPRMAGAHPYAPAVIVPHGRDGGGRVCYARFTLKKLNEMSDRLARGLEKVGIMRATRCALMVKPGLDFFALTFALFKVGAVPVMIDPGIGIKGLGACLDEAEPAAFIGIPKAHFARILFGWGKRTTRILVTVGNRICWGGFTLDDLVRFGRDDGPYRMAKTPPDETAAVLFTSGSTGVPKGAVYSHGIFIAQVEILRSVYGIQPGEVDLASFPLFALFGPALGMAAVIPDMDPTRPAKADPAKIAQAIEDFGATNMFASPALLNVMGRWGAAKGAVLPSLKRVISAGAPARADSLERFIKLLAPGVQVFTPYGATESLPVSSIGTDEILGKTEDLTAQGKGVCVGKPVPGMEVAVIKISDEPLGEWSDNLRLGPREIGEIAVKGPVVTKEYFNRPESARLAKISDGEGGIWHRMGDVGYMDDEGRIWFCGRKSQRVQTAEGTLFTIPCEAVFNTHPDVYRTALTGVGPKGRQIPALCVELEPGVPRARHDAIRKELKALGAAWPHTSGIETFLFHPSFPVDVRHNAKIFREKLALWALRRLK